MPDAQLLQMICEGATCCVRPLRQEYYPDQNYAGLVRAWNAIADRADCRVLFVDCSCFRHMDSALLGELVMLHRRLQRRQGTLVLCGLWPETREVLARTRLDRYFKIGRTDGPQAVA